MDKFRKILKLKLKLNLVQDQYQQ